MCHHMAHLRAAPATTSQRVGEEGRLVAAANVLVGQATQHPLGVVEHCICICVSVSECARLSLSLHVCTSERERACNLATTRLCGCNRVGVWCQQ